MAEKRSADFLEEKALLSKTRADMRRAYRNS